MSIKKIGNISEKTPVLKSLFDKVAGLLIKDIFIKKKTPTQVFSCEYSKIIKKQFFYRISSALYTFLKFYLMIEFFGRIWVQNWYFSYFLCHCFVFFHNSSVRIRRLWLFCAGIHTKIFSKYNFQEQLQEVIWKKRFSWKFHKIHRKTLVPEYFFKYSCRP